LRISKYLLKNYKKTILYKYFSIILDSCIVKSKKQLGKCKTKKNQKYIILYSKNAGCKPLTKYSKVFVKNNKIKINNIQYNMIISNNQKFKKNNVKRLIKILSLLHKFNVIHFDIKLDNIISNNKKELRLIDFGVSILLSDLQALNLNHNFNVLLNKFHSNFYGWTNNYISPEIIIISKLYENNNIDKNNMIILLKNKLEESFYV
jgi:serine/threonine protein kinase